MILAAAVGVLFAVVVALCLVEYIGDRRTRLDRESADDDSFVEFDKRAERRADV